MKARITLALVLVCFLAAWPSARAADGAVGSKLLLQKGWSVQSSDGISQGGEDLSRPGFSASSWHSAEMPSTVLAVLVESGVYLDPYFGFALREVPGNYPPPLDVSAVPMTATSPFRKSWWYRAEFEVPDSFAGHKAWLHFDGINYQADIWLNGKKIADSDLVAGAYRQYEFEVGEELSPGKKNALAILVFAPRKNDLAIAWVDWNPAPPDRDMGIWHDVYLTASGPVTIRHPQVITDLDLPALDLAHLTVNLDLKNASDRPVSGALAGTIGGIEFSKQVELGPGESRTIVITPQEVPALDIKDPKLWWPYQLGSQNLHELELRFLVEGKVSDRAAMKFGIREISSQFVGENARMFRINGKSILIRGAGWAPDMMLRQSPDRLEDEIRYVKQMNLNTIRLEGKLETDLFYELCDREGVLVLAGWCCCSHWERWWKWDGEDYRVAEASERDQILRLRGHASLAGWLNGSDNPPPPKVERTYLRVLEECRWPNPVISSATEAPTEVTGNSGVKMTGPYEYVVPVYWYQDTKNGGAFGFNTETSPGPAPPPVESLRRMLPADHLWPIDEYWNYHAGRVQFGNIEVFSKALDARYGQARSLDDFALKSQAMTYEAQRAMFEAYGRNKYQATGVIQWMLNDAWPSLIWHLYDYYLRPGGGFYGTMRACEPLHVQYSYDDRSVVVVNGLPSGFDNLEVSARVFDLDMKPRFSKQEIVSIGEDESKRVFNIPEPADLSTTYFVRLDLSDAGAPVSSNFYWLSTKAEELNWPASTWFYTPTKSFADFSALEGLPEVELEASADVVKEGDEYTARVSVKNPSPSLAFLVHLKMVKGKGGDEVLPVFWDDNYFSLLPGETREIEGSCRGRDLAGPPVIELDGWNVKPASAP